MKQIKMILAVMILGMSSVFSQDKFTKVEDIHTLETNTIVKVVGQLHEEPFTHRDFDHAVIVPFGRFEKVYVFFKPGEKQKYRGAILERSFVIAVKGKLQRIDGVRFPVILEAEYCLGGTEEEAIEAGAAIGDYSRLYETPTTTSLWPQNQIEKDLKPGQQGSFVAAIKGLLHYKASQLDILNDFWKRYHMPQAIYSDQDSVMSVGAGATIKYKYSTAEEELPVSVQLVFDQEWLKSTNVDLETISKLSIAKKHLYYPLFALETFVVVTGNYSHHVDVRGYRVYVFKNCKLNYATVMQALPFKKVVEDVLKNQNK